ncbi:hypothetical protein HERIO_1219 [Hepatospora eriocheir]|uniref:Uncharacterized protein n=1 Tax=Hepatospora eriocheir TaxID=1081669 RepID=A0A1X0QAU5_9MICR|nr:hypothetical protein HERIO_1219 [Hepatospora eriocheir]
MLDDKQIRKYRDEVGLSEEKNTEILENLAKELSKLERITVNELFGDLLLTLILEDFDNTILFIQNNENKLVFDKSFVTFLLTSNYYEHRKSYLSLDCSRSDILQYKTNLKLLVRDPVIDVVKLAVEQICLFVSEFYKEALLEIALDLYNNLFVSIKVLSVDILLLTDTPEYLLDELLTNYNWRVRYYVAQNVIRFNDKLQDHIFYNLKDDSIEDVRIILAKNSCTLNTLYFLDDSSEIVRGSYLYNIISILNDDLILDVCLKDKSWLVRKNFLYLKGERFIKYTLPMLKSIRTVDIHWRERVEIFKLLEFVINDRSVAKCLLKPFLKGLKENFAQIREKAGRNLIKIANNFPQLFEKYFENILEIVNHDCYSVRISVIPLIWALSKTYSDFDVIKEKLMNDSIENVRLAAIEFEKHGEFRHLNFFYKSNDKENIFK